MNLETGRGPLHRGSMIRSIAILSGALLFAALVPFFGSVLLFLSPLPILYYYFRLGRMRGLAVVASSVLLATVILVLLGHRPNLAIVATIVYSGIMIAEVLKKNYSLNKSVGSAAAALFVAMVAFIAFGAFRAGLSPFQMIERHLTNLIRENVKIYGQLNIPEDQIRLVSENVPQIAGFFTEIFPALLLASAIIAVFVNVFLLHRLLGRTGIVFPGFGDLALWKAPEKLVWVLIAAGGMLLAPLDILNTVAMNLLIICCLLYLFQGLSIAGFFFRTKKVPPAFRWFFYFLILIQQYMVILVIAFGLFDLWVDFRKRISGINDAHA